MQKTLQATVSTFRGDGDVENSNNSYGAISDEKLKENVAEASSQWDDLKAVQVRKYSFKSDNLDSPNQLGVIAQELEASGMAGLVNESQTRHENRRRFRHCNQNSVNIQSFT